MGRFSGTDSWLREVESHSMQMLAGCHLFGDCELDRYPKDVH